MRPRIKLVLFSYAMLCLAGGISLVAPETTLLSESATAGTPAVEVSAALACDAIKVQFDYPDMMLER